MQNMNNNTELEMRWSSLGAPYVSLRVTSPGTFTAADLHSFAEVVEAVELLRETEGAEPTEPIPAVEMT